MTKLNARVDKLFNDDGVELLNGEVFERQVDIYIKEIDDYVTVCYYLKVADQNKLVEGLGLTGKLNKLAEEYADDTELYASVWNTVNDQLVYHPYDKGLPGVVSLK